MLFMRTCPYCHQPCSEDPGTEHNACGLEFERRRDNGLCVRCGEKITKAGIAPYYHDPCLRMGDEGFTGYPGE